MPLPLIPIAVAGVSVASAIFAGIKGKETYDNYKEARDKINNAQKRYNNTEKVLKTTQEEVQSKFDTLGHLQASIINNSLERYKNLIDQLDIESKDLQEIIGEETLSSITQTEQVIVDLKSALSGLVAGGVAGSMAGFGAIGGVGLFASAGTGTAISSLSGVAATNATLAWLGGGTLASGGLGIAGGMWVLGGIVAAPLIAVSSLVIAKFSEGKFYDALSYDNTIDALIEAMKAEKLGWGNIIQRIEEKMTLLKETDILLKAKLDEVFAIFVKKGTEAGKWDTKEQENLQKMIQLAETIVNTINAPLMNDEDSLTKEIIEHQKKCQEIIEEINRKWGK